jgi:uncharacterized protein YciI
MHFVMFYEFTADYLQRRGEFRNEHLRLAWESQKRGELVLGGAYADPADGALLLFKCESETVPQEFARTDPYVRNGLVTRWTVRRWTTVVGDAAMTPVRPS